MENAKRDEVVMELLECALAMPGNERQNYLRATAGSPEILAEVLDRLAWEERMAGFLQVPLLELASTADPGALIPAGRRIGHYLVQEELGRGGMGVVFRAVDQNLGRTVALKVLSGSAASALDRRRFLREAKAASALNHPNIVAIHEFNSEAGQDFIAMEYIQGQTLDKAASARQDLAVRLGYARQIALALATAHAAGIVHRDLKPGNIMVTGNGEVKVLDFGLAKHERAPVTTGESDETQTTDVLTHAGAILGTPAYMSPEQVTGDAVDQRSDIFSFGVILYEMFAGKRPFAGGSGAKLLVQIAGKPHQPVCDLNPAIPPALADLIDRCLAKKPDDRPVSMQLVAVELSAILAGLAQEPAARRSPPWLVIAAVLVVVAAGIWFAKRPSPPATSTQTQPSPALHNVHYSLLNEQGFATSPNQVFHGGTRFRFRVRASNPGRLYLVNEGPGENGRIRLYVLMPRPGASAAVSTNEERLTDPLVFDQNPGVERMWIVWSDRPVASLEEAANGPQRGEVRDLRSAAQIQQFLESLQSDGKTVQIASGNEVQIQGAGNTLGSLIQLRHQ